MLTAKHAIEVSAAFSWIDAQRSIGEMLSVMLWIYERFPVVNCPP